MSVWQSGQSQITDLEAAFQVPVENGGPSNTVIPMNGGSFTANGATPVTVANANVTATSFIMFALKTVGGSVGAIPAVQTKTAGTGFTVAATAGDTSDYTYLILA